MDQWTNTRELLTDWSANWLINSNLNSIGRDLPRWHGLSLWWMSNLVRKDVSVDNDWFLRLHRRLHGMPPPDADPAPMPRMRNLISLLMRDLLRSVLIRTTFGRSTAPTVDIWFHSFGYNLVRSSNVVRDRNFCDAPSRGHLYKKQVGYLISLMPKLPRLSNLLQWQRDQKALVASLEHPAVMLDCHVSPLDVLRCHSSAALHWLSVRHWRRRGDIRSRCKISGISCDDILLDEFERSFSGPIQQTMLYATGLAKFLRRQNEALSVVTYGELLGPMRAVYYMARQTKSDIRLITIQHAMACQNKMATYSLQQEFAQHGEAEGDRFSPSPDLFLVQGPQYREILEGFFPPQRVRTIGCLKYDSWLPIIDRQPEIADKIRRQLCVGNKRLLVVAPSVNDDAEIFHILRHAPWDGSWLIVGLPHPVVSRERLTSVAELHGLGAHLVIPEGVSMLELLAACDLVVCGSSTVAIEAAIFAKPSIRAIDPNTFPQFPEDSMIPCFSDPAEFSKWLSSGFQKTKRHSIKAYRAMVENYFYRLDGASCDRLWQAIICP
jgi:hypothetical protein